MLLLFGGAGILGNWLAGIALSRNALLTLRVFLFSWSSYIFLAFTSAGLFSSWQASSVSGVCTTAGFLIGQTRSTSEAPEAPELAASLMVSFGNAGVTAGTLLAGLSSPIMDPAYHLDEHRPVGDSPGISSIVVKKRAARTASLEMESAA